MKKLKFYTTKAMLAIACVPADFAAMGLYFIGTVI